MQCKRTAANENHHGKSFKTTNEAMVAAQTNGSKRKSPRQKFQNHERNNKCSANEQQQTKITTATVSKPQMKQWMQRKRTAASENHHGKSLKTTNEAMDAAQTNSSRQKSPRQKFRNHKRDNGCSANEQQQTGITTAKVLKPQTRK